MGVGKLVKEDGRLSFSSELSSSRISQLLRGLGNSACHV